MDPEAGRQTASAGDTHDPRPRGADGGGAGLGTDLRGGPAAGATRLPPRPQCLGRGQASPRAAERGLYGRGRCGLERVLRQHPARRTDEVGGTSDQRSAAAASGEDVAGSAGRGNRRAGRTQRTTRNKDEGRGTPQGGVVSPLLANLYMRRFVLGWKVLGHEQRLDAHIVNYADDFVICCRGHGPTRPWPAMRGMMAKLKLTVNEQKTRRCRLPDGDVHVPGLHVRPCSTRFEDGACLSGDATRSTKKVQRAVPRDQRADGSTTWRTGLEEQVRRLNQKLVGWAQLLLSRPVTEPTSACRSTHVRTAPPVAVSQASGAGAGTARYPRRVSATTSSDWSSSMRRTAPPAVGERVNPCPRAGCGKSARPVR